MRRYFKITSTMKVIFLIACIVAVCSCKKDYQKLATEFERQLPDTIVVVKVQINDIAIMSTSRIRITIILSVTTWMTIWKRALSPILKMVNTFKVIYLGKENIAFLVTDGNDGYSFWYYNLKTLKLSNIDGGFYSAYANEIDNTLSALWILPWEG